MARLARWCFAHRWRVVAAWLLALAAIAGASAAAGTDFTTNLALPGTDSQAAAIIANEHAISKNAIFILSPLEFHVRMNTPHEPIASFAP